jgi:hypothetical protein
MRPAAYAEKLVSMTLPASLARATFPSLATMFDVDVMFFTSQIVESRRNERACRM